MVRYIGATKKAVGIKQSSMPAAWDPTVPSRKVLVVQAVCPFPKRTPKWQLFPIFDVCERGISWQSCAAALKHLVCRGDRVIGISPQLFVMLLWAHALGNGVTAVRDRFSAEALHHMLGEKGFMHVYFKPFFVTTLRSLLNGEKKPAIVTFAVMKRPTNMKSKAKHFVSWVCTLDQVPASTLLWCVERSEFCGPETTCTSARCYVKWAIERATAAPRITKRQSPGKSLVALVQLRNQLVSALRSSVWRKEQTVNAVEALASTAGVAYWTTALHAMQFWSRGKVPFYGRSRPKETLKPQERGCSMHFFANHANVFGYSAIFFTQMLAFGENIRVTIKPVLALDVVKPTSSLSALCYGRKAKTKTVVTTATAETQGLTWCDLRAATILGVEHLIVYVDAFEMLSMAGPMVDLIYTDAYDDTDLTPVFVSMSEKWANDPLHFEKMFSLTAYSSADCKEASIDHLRRYSKPRPVVPPCEPTLQDLLDASQTMVALKQPFAAELFESVMDSAVESIVCDIARIFRPP